jgi:hypothetical protein
MKMTTLKIITLLTALFAGVRAMSGRFIIASPMLVRRGMMHSPTRIVATVRRFIRHFAGTFARGLAHVHHRNVA